ncbi:hypothetical protein RR46_14394 [Papilio xuthus]|uniref:Uncharacterized protein n=1 Tax=Papilio xuthus TaxID=66420 RepID=A0A194PIH1_PAPXU|nr:hypothetical protein RR46_14394 [Papilio xuthus]
MPRLEQQPPEDFRRVLREKALNHSLFYLKLSAGIEPDKARADLSAQSHAQRRASGSGLVSAAPPARLRHAQPRVSELLRRFEPAPMQYLRIPRAATPPEDITSSDDDDRAAVRRRSRDLSDDSAVELEPRPRRHSHPRDVTPPPGAPSPRRERTLVEAHVVQLGRRGSEGCETRGRCVRTPSVVVSDYSDGVAVGATAEEAAWLRARSLSADSACSSCSTLSSRDDEEFESPTLPKKTGYIKICFYKCLSSSYSAWICPLLNVGLLHQLPQYPVLCRPHPVFSRHVDQVGSNAPRWVRIVGADDDDD